MPIEEKLELLWPLPKEINTTGEFSTPRKISLTGEPLAKWLIDDLAEIPHIQISKDHDAYTIKLEISKALTQPESYELSLKTDGAQIIAPDQAGLSYAIRTLEQLLVYFPTKFPEIEIKDRPAFKKRCFMPDMGRATWPLPLLKRIVRILQRLKMNQLHLHLYDDELCSIKFDGLPFGYKNPYAISLEEFKELVEYAAKRHVEIIPELEAWGHVGSIVYHRPELRGGVGMFHGSSFIICEETFELIKNMFRQIAQCMSDKATIHLGLDEANWYLGENMPADFTPSDMVQRYYDIVQDVADELGKELKLSVWADHAGRPIPEKIKNNITIQPWSYCNSHHEKRQKDIENYSGQGKPTWIAGAGVSGGQYRGSYHATRSWARQTKDSPNIEGINITFWCWNNIDEKFISLFAGAHDIWNPDAKTSFADFTDYEDYDQKVFPIMYRWQALFKDGNPDELTKDRGPKVFLGHYHFGGRHNQPVAPTAPAAGSLANCGHDYLNEINV